MPTPPTHTTLPVPMPALASRPESSGHTRATLLPRACAALTTAIGILVLMGWVLNVPHLRSLDGQATAIMNPLTAICFVALAASLWMQAVAGNSRQRHVARGLAAVVMGLSTLHLAASALGVLTGMEGLTVNMSSAGSGDARAQLVPTATSLNFALLSLALLNVVRRSVARVAMAQVLASVALSFSLVALLGHSNRNGWFETIGVFNRMALPSSLAIAFTAIGILLLRRRAGIIAVALAEGPGATMARGLLPAGFLVPAILGWIAIWALRREKSGTVATNPELVFTLFALSMIVIFVGLVAWNATLVHESHLERARAEAALRDSEVRFRLLAENGSDVVSLHDLTGRVIYSSPSCERIFGFSPEEISRMGPFAMVHPDDGERLRRHFDDLIRGAPVTAISCRMLHKTGKHLWIEMMWRAVVNREGKVVRLQASSRDITERKDYERQIEEARRKLQMNQESLIEANTRLAALATLDGLTGLKNRRAFEERLVDELTRAKRSARPITLLLLDIDHFKAFNDSFGHPRGDEVLRLVARQLSRSIRDSDFAARYGGEEFAIILPDTDRDGAMQMGERLREAIQGATWRERDITVSVGAAIAAHSGTTVEALVDQADRALYRSKQFGRNRVTLAA
jgi:diguanylate cyclase (GGDEF)-like protein/PAS domain S-box-containing protein